MSSFWLVMRCSVAPGYDISVTVQRLTRLGRPLATKPVRSGNFVVWGSSVCDTASPVQPPNRPTVLQLFRPRKSSRMRL